MDGPDAEWTQVGPLCHAVANNGNCSLEKWAVTAVCLCGSAFQAGKIADEITAASPQYYTGK